MPADDGGELEPPELEAPVRELEELAWPRLRFALALFRAADGWAAKGSALRAALGRALERNKIGAR